VTRHTTIVNAIISKHKNKKVKKKNSQECEEQLAVDLGEIKQHYKTNYNTEFILITIRHKILYLTAGC